MKNLLPVMIVAVFAHNINAQIVNIPDANFKTYLIGNASISNNTDAEIQVSEANSFTGSINQ